MFLRSVRGFSVSATARSSYEHNVRNTVSHIHSLYREQTPISMVTAYDYMTSRMNDAAGVDITLVGDSLANTTLGYRDTNELSLEEMLFHVRSVRRGSARALLVADMPFGSFETSLEQATETSIKLVKAGVQAVKIEGGDDRILATIEKLLSVGIPVMGHLGLTPQRHNAMGGYRLQGASVESAEAILQAAHNLQDAGVFSMVLECIPTQLAKIITQSLDVPTIGIGAGHFTSGQVLVNADLLGMQSGPVPRFAHKYANFFDIGVQGLKEYTEQVKNRSFPTPDHGYKIKKDVLEKLKENISMKL
ncbi:uncharacterized protein LODBEIA_P29380 [Lodderomyces beijingensis]|uniref:3-methyl-2-oxobutanoate hydroxymethyltransferase n=1 Tax=Lodderomyces beijingensis TaxID=1775926 RepID=A0ABP0ZKN6_9ASCO